MSITFRIEYHVICDHGACYPTGELICDQLDFKGKPNYKKFLKIIKEIGWLIMKEENRHYCPECRKKLGL